MQTPTPTPAPAYPTTRVYISGPMRGYPERNHRAFDAAERYLRGVHEVGCEIFNPVNNDRRLGFDFNTPVTNDDIRMMMAADCDWICNKATLLHMLPGWSMSRGARAEHALAVALGIPVSGAAS